MDRVDFQVAAWAPFWPPDPDGRGLVSFVKFLTFSAKT